MANHFNISSHTRVFKNVPTALTMIDLPIGDQNTRSRNSPVLDLKYGLGVWIYTRGKM